MYDIGAETRIKREIKKAIVRVADWRSEPRSVLGDRMIADETAFIAAQTKILAEITASLKK